MAAGLPWAPAITGSLTFPHNRDVTTDYATAAAETWTDSAGGGAQTFTGKVIAADVIDVDHLLTLQGGPWFIFAATIDFGASGDISGDGPDGVASTNMNRDYAIGAWVTTGAANAAGGGGGVMVFIVAAAVTGSNRTISANGGDGARSTDNAGSVLTRGGEGALAWAGNATGSVAAAELWYGATLRELPIALGELLGDGSATTQTAAGNGVGGRGGGSGQGGGTSNVNDGGGGSGIGGGGRSGGGGDGAVARIEANPLQLLELGQRGCKGGGGGAAGYHTTGSTNGGGGGGAGSVCLWGKTLTATPTLSVSGGAGAPGGDGAAGVSYLIDVP